MEEKFQGIYWPKTLVNKGQHMSCPYPCTGMKILTYLFLHHFGILIDYRSNISFLSK